MTNLLQETIEDIKTSGHSPEDIIFIGSEGDGYSCTWQEFQDLGNEEYYSGYGSAKVGTDLIIVFADGAKMWRTEYDGAENWEFSTPFVMPKKTKPIERIIGDYWPSLKNLQDDTDDHHNPNVTPAKQRNNEAKEPES